MALYTREKDSEQHRNEARYEFIKLVCLIVCLAAIASAVTFQVVTRWYGSGVEAKPWAYPIVIQDPPNVTLASFYDYSIPSGLPCVRGTGCYTESHRTAASRDFPRGSMLKVCNTANGSCVGLKITDTGPDASVFPERGLDLSSYAFSQIADLKLGVIKVTYELIKQ